LTGRKEPVILRAKRWKNFIVNIRPPMVLGGLKLTGRKEPVILRAKRWKNFIVNIRPPMVLFG
jgi:hypothetical protein